MSNKSIAVVGANQGALAFACFAAENGFEVTVFEKKKRADVAYEWYDDMHFATFADTGIQCPSVINSVTTPGVRLISPKKMHSVSVSDKDNSCDVPVLRRELNEKLFERALKAGVTFRYECGVSSVITDNSSIKGVLLENGENFLCGLTVDCTGAQSVLREGLPNCFMIPQKINPEDMFFVTRTYYERPGQTLNKPFERKIYLKHLNERGISWCFPSYDGKAADVLIGRLGGLTRDSAQAALCDLKNENKIIGDTAIFGGYLCTIPVRRPISRMVANGYALLGDSAYMTVPMNGSGISHSLYAAKMLADVIASSKGEAFSISNLYRYQVKYFCKIGAFDAPVELIKNWMLNSKDGDVDFLMQKGILNAQILGGIQGSPGIKTVLSLIKPVLSGLSKPGLIKELLATVSLMGKQTKISLNIPPVYNETELIKWQTKYERAYQKR